MREFVDGEGRKWDVVVGRESWGSVYALFIPADQEGTLRQTLLATSSYQDAIQELQGASSSELGRLLRQSEPKEMDG